MALRKVEYQLELTLNELAITRQTSTSRFSLQFFFGSARHRTDEFDCVEQTALNRRVRLSSLVNDQLEVWLMQGDQILAYAYAPVSQDEKEIALVLALDNE